MRLGERDGFGRFGDLDDDGATVLCHECGRRLKSIAAHVVRVHDIPARDYKVRHGLPLGQALCSKAVSERMSAGVRAVQGADYMRAIATKVDQTVAAQRHRETLAEYREVFTSGLRAQRKHLARREAVWTCPGCGAQWCNLATTDTPRVTCSERCRRHVGARRKKLTAAERAARDTEIRHQIHGMGQTVREVARHHGLPLGAIRRILATRDTAPEPEPSAIAHASSPVTQHDQQRHPRSA
ncbi:MucR family transcriptional regulator [Williamsia maris]|uniref:MucR family transcriptional regulator n=1 Tax=Williamsia maris TaxID=72806 RepID=UPI0020A29226|nr:MucR family transcriptional regulator [Williamsia maris]